MRILIALTYYRPHVSGLTIYAERLARGLSRHGHQVTVLTARFSPTLAARETVAGVDIVRVPVLRKVSKGVITPQTGPQIQYEWIAPGSMFSPTGRYVRPVAQADQQAGE